MCKFNMNFLNNAKTMKKSCKNYRFPYIFAKTMNFGHVNYEFRELNQFGIRAPYNTTTIKKENNKYNKYYGIHALL